MSHLNVDLAVILTTDTAQARQLTEILSPFYRRVDLCQQLSHLAETPDLLVVDYSAAPDHEWHTLQERGAHVLLLIPDTDPDALTYALECRADDYTVITAPLNRRVLEHRIHRMKRQTGEAMLVDALQSTAIALSSTLDFEEVLDRILINLENVVPYDLADVMLVEDGVARIVRHRGYQEHHLEQVISQIRFTVNQLKTLLTMAETGKPLYIPDTHTSPIWVQVVDKLAWRRTYLGAPLFVHGRLAGFLNLNSRERDAYSREAVRRLEVFASQVSVAISNAQLHDTVIRHTVELEQRIRDLITVYAIGQALTSTLDLQEIYTMLYQEVAQGLFEARQMRVVLLDKENQTLHYNFAIDAGIPQDVNRLTFSPDDVERFEEVLALRQTVKKGSSVYEPLLSRKRVIGILQILHDNERDFDEVDVTLLTTIASLAAIAVENAQLYALINSQHDEMAALYRATTTLFVFDNLDSLARQITDTIVNEFQHSECGLMLVDRDSREIKRVARSGSYVVSATVPLFPESAGLVPEAVRTGRIVYAPDVENDPRYIVGDPRTHSELVIPLHTPQGIIGALDLQSPELDGFNERDMLVLQAFAERAAIALENMRLMDEIRLHAADLERRVAERTLDLRRALEKERELNELKTRFVMTVSHQFRTPLTAILSAKEMLKNYGERMTPEQRDQRYDMLDNAVTEMVRLIEDSIMINQMTGEGLQFTPILIELERFTRDIVLDFASRTGKSHRIVYASDGKEAFNLVDSDMWRKAVSELLLNATKFSAAGSKIECLLSTVGSEVIFSVKDEGMGIAPDDLGRIFGVFDRGVNVENIPGTGLGLAIVKQSIERHGGSVTVDSQPETGTTVTLHLPKYVLEVTS
jgi:K+-sensing histidine kinase KdpD